MKKLSLFCVLILMVTMLVGCTKKTQEESMPLSETAPEGAVVVEDTASAKEPAQAVAKDTVVTNVSSREGATSGPSEVSDKPTNEQIQQVLKNAGLYAGSIDGVMGKKTKKAIEDFQSQNDLKVDGKVGPQTWGKLKTYLSGSQENSTSD